MLRNIQIIEKSFGGLEQAAKALGITPHHLRRVKRTNHASKTLQYLIERIARDIRNAA